MSACSDDNVRDYTSYFIRNLAMYSSCVPYVASLNRAIFAWLKSAMVPYDKNEDHQKLSYGPGVKMG